MTAALLGIATGVAAGAVLAGNGLCFNAGLRRAAFGNDGLTLRALAVAVGAQLLLLPLLVELGVAPLDRSVHGGSPALLPAAQAAGGLMFGVGMALAGGCIAGILWKSGAGSVATAIAVLGFAAGELLVRGPGRDLIVRLDEVSAPSESSLQGLTGLPYAALAVPLGIGALALLARGARRATLVAGIALAAVGAGAWIAADLAGYGYGLGFVGAAQGTRRALETGGGLPFQLWLALGVLAGARLAVRGPLRMPDPAHAGRALGGGLLMGIGGNLAHGCNIGHGLTGLPLLSLGSALAVASMAAGSLVTWRVVLRARPALRGVERPPAPGW
jgi:uncharacterized protein